jgi:hypothetical protein
MRLLHTDALPFDMSLEHPIDAPPQESLLGIVANRKAENRTVYQFELIFLTTDDERTPEYRRTCCQFCQPTPGLELSQTRLPLFLAVPCDLVVVCSDWILLVVDCNNPRRHAAISYFIRFAVVRATEVIRRAAEGNSPLRP